MRFDIAVSLDGESDLKRLMIQHDQVEKVIDMGIVLPCQEEIFFVILNDFSLKRLSGNTFEPILEIFDLQSGDDH